MKFKGLRVLMSTNHSILESLNDVIRSKSNFISFSHSLSFLDVLQSWPASLIYSDFLLMLFFSDDTLMMLFFFFLL